MKKLILFFVLVFSISSVNSQSCLPHGITFDHQWQIDYFQDQHPNCTEILGSVHIFNPSGSISNLYGLSCLTSIVGDLKINAADELTSLAGLEGIETIGGDLWIGRNIFLYDLAGFEGLISIGGSLRISQSTLQNLQGLSGLSAIGSDLIIIGNTSLFSLSGIDNISTSSINNLVIKNNPHLSHCALDNFCSYISNPNGELLIQNNSNGCSSLEEVLDSCEAHAGYIDTDHDKEDFFIYPNPANQELNISAKRFTIDELAIYTLTGRQVLRLRPIISETIDISSLLPGIYIVEVTVEGRKVRRKLLVE